MFIRISMIVSCLWFSVSGANAVQTESETVVSIDGEIFSLGDFNICKLDLGSVSSGQTLVIKAKLTSRSSRDLSFGSVSTSCRCTSVTPESGEIPAFGSIDLQIRLGVPESNSAIRFPAAFNLVSDDGSEIIVNLFMEIASNLYVDPVHQFAVSEKFLAFIPITLSAPILFENLLLEVPKNFDGLAEFSLAIEDDQPGIRIMADRLGFSSEYSSGEIKIHDSVSLKSTASNILFRASQPIAISPTIIHFYKTPAPDESTTNDLANEPLNVQTQSYEAKGLLRIDSNELQQIGKFKVHCKVGDKICETKLTELTTNLYRITLTMSPPANLPRFPKVVWKIEGRRSIEIEGAALFGRAR